MKKYKEWLKNEIENMGSETSENYPHEQMVDREEVLNLIDQLDEPAKVVIPQFVLVGGSAMEIGRALASKEVAE